MLNITRVILVVQILAIISSQVRRLLLSGRHHLSYMFIGGQHFHPVGCMDLLLPRVSILCS